MNWNWVHFEQDVVCVAYHAANSSARVVTDAYFSFECVDFDFIWLIIDVKFIEISVKMK